MLGRMYSGRLMQAKKTWSIKRKSYQALDVTEIRRVWVLSAEDVCHGEKKS